MANHPTNNLLSPNAAPEQTSGPKQRRKSTLSGNGFFIDYSHTRRKSSAAFQEQQQVFARNQLLRAHVSPVRWPRTGSVCSGQQRAGQIHSSQPSSPSRAQSQPLRASLVPSASNKCQNLLLSTIHAPSALAGSRKTSIFDPTGHSIAPHVLTSRRSVMHQPAALVPKVTDTTTILSAARRATTKGGQPRRKDELVRDVPVIGCSPTSIRASLAALDETRRYQKFLRRLQRHQKRKEKRKFLENQRRLERLGLFGTDVGGHVDFGRKMGSSNFNSTTSLRRKSVRAIREAAMLLSKASGSQLGKRRDTIDGLSISSMSFASSHSSLPSMAQLEFDANNEGGPLELQRDGGPARFEAARNQGEDIGKASQWDRGRRWAAKQTSGHHLIGKKSLVKSAMRKLASTIVSRQQAVRSPQAKSACLSQEESSMSNAGGLSYWYYYCYLRENSRDVIDDLPINASGVGGSGQISETEKRTRLNINYSLARIEILNSRSDPVARLVSKISEASEKLQSDESSPLENIFDYNQSTDLSLSLSTSSATPSAPSDEQASSASPSPVSLSDSSRKSSQESSQVQASYAAGFARGPKQSISSQSVRSCGERESVSADDENTSADMDPSRFSAPQLVRRHRRVRLNQRQPSGSGEVVRGAEFEARQLANHESGARKEACRLFVDGESVINKSSPIRHSHNNLATRNPQSDLLTIGNGQRSASFAIASSADNNEEELDDFERFNRSHRGYKPPPAAVAQCSAQTLTVATAQATTTSHFQDKSADESPARAISGGSRRVSSFRLSFKSFRSSRRDRRARQRSRTSMSWDTLASETADSSSGKAAIRSLGEQDGRLTLAHKLVSASSELTTTKRQSKAANHRTLSSAERLDGSNYQAAAREEDQATISAANPAPDNNNNNSSGRSGSCSSNNNNNNHDNHRASAVMKDHHSRAPSPDVGPIYGKQEWRLQQQLQQRDGQNRLPDQGNSLRPHHYYQYCDCHTREEQAGGQGPWIEGGSGSCCRLGVVEREWRANSSRSNLRPGSRERARSHTSIVNLEREQNLKPERIGQLNGRQPSGGQAEDAGQLRSGTAASLRVPRWGRNAASSNDISASRELSAYQAFDGLGERQLRAGDESNLMQRRDRRQTLEFRGPELRVGVQSEVSPRLTWHGETQASNAGSRVEPRTRAHSTGSGGGSSRAARVAAGFANSCTRADSVARASRKSINVTTTATQETSMKVDSEFQVDSTGQRRAGKSHFDERLSRQLGRPKLAEMRLMEDANHRRNIESLAKSSFTCMLIGARQTVDEYKKESILLKLLDCSAKLQGLASQQPELDTLDRYMLERGQQPRAPRSRINSWLGTGKTGVSKLLNLPKPNKRRLNSAISATRESSFDSIDKHIQHRRHTTIDQGATGSENAPDDSGSDDANHLTVPEARTLDGNKSDLDPRNESTFIEQLQVPVVSVEYRKQSTAGLVDRRSSECPSRFKLLPNSDLQTQSKLKDTTEWPYSEGARLSLRDLNRRRCKIQFKTRRQLSERHVAVLSRGSIADLSANLSFNHAFRSTLPDSFIVVYSINDRDSFDYAEQIIGRLRSVKREIPLPVILVANKIDLERVKVVKSEEGRSLARKNGCKFMEISCTVGFNLDNLLVGLRAQLILKHHETLNSIIHSTPTSNRGDTSIQDKDNGGRDQIADKGNILKRFYRRYMTDHQELTYDCENFSKL